MDFFVNNYRCMGGGYCQIMADDWKYFKEGMESKCWINGKSSTYGPADMDLVKKVIEESEKFDKVTIGEPFSN